MNAMPRVIDSLLIGFAAAVPTFWIDSVLLSMLYSFAMGGVGGLLLARYQLRKASQNDDSG